VLRSRRAPALAPVLFACLAALPAGAIVVGGAFGPGGEGGDANGQPIQIGPGGAVFEVDAFVSIEGQDLNGAGTSGTSAQLSADPLPSGLAYAFASSLEDSDTDLRLRYTFTNNTGGALAGVSFFSFVDAEIDEVLNTFFNEYAETSGSLASGQSFEADEPGFVFGDLFTNLLDGALDGSNGVPISAPDDVALALGFSLGTLGIGQSAIVEILLSQDGDRLGSFALTHRDSDPESLTVITLSGLVVPEPATALLLAGGLAAIGMARRRA
jgi:hypothetical protein